MAIGAACGGLWIALRPEPTAWDRALAQYIAESPSQLNDPPSPAYPGPYWAGLMRATELSFKRGPWTDAEAEEILEMIRRPMPQPHEVMDPKFAGVGHPRVGIAVRALDMISFRWKNGGPMDPAHSERMLEVILTWISDPEPFLRWTASRALLASGAIAHPLAWETVQPLRQDPDEFTRNLAIRDLGNFEKRCDVPCRRAMVERVFGPGSADLMFGKGAP